jgi:hypothetical protein
MLQNYLSIDLHNGSISCRFNDVNYLFSTPQIFLDTSGYPFGETTRILSYEPDRNIFVVERLNGEMFSCSDLPEIQWIANNITAIEQSAIADLANQPPVYVPTLRDQRDALLFATDWVLTRWQEETTINVAHSITEQKFADVLMYRQALRDITNVYTSLDDVVWPTNPLA